MDKLLTMLPPILNGAETTLKLFVITLLLSLPLGLALALARVSKWGLFVNWSMATSG